MVHYLEGVFGDEFGGGGGGEVVCACDLAAGGSEAADVGVDAGDPDVGGAGVDLDAEGLGRGADCDVEVVAAKEVSAWWDENRMSEGVRDVNVANLRRDCLPLDQPILLFAYPFYQTFFSCCSFLRLGCIPPPHS